MAQLIYFEGRGFAEISRMLMTLMDIEVGVAFSYAAVTTTIRLRSDRRSTGVRRPFDCLSKLVKLSVT